MKGDALASGGATATFPGGKPSVDDPINFNWTVAKEEKEQEQIIAEKRDEERHEAIIRQLQPFNDRVLLRRVKEDDTKRVQLADAYKPAPNRGKVLAVGDGMVLGLQFRPIPVTVGDVVVFGEYNAESIDIDGEELVLVSAFDIRLRMPRES